MGTRGPAPKRESQRRRANGKTTKKTAAKKAAAKKAAAQAKPVTGELRTPDPDWHPVAVAWFEALEASGQSVFYQQSDWATARLVAEAMSRDLKPQPVVTKDGDVVQVTMPVKGASLAAYRSHMATLLVTEGDRRRVELELGRPGAGDDEGGSDASWTDDLSARRAAREQRGGAG